ncbi:Polyphenol oxidase 2 [Leucoagaricus sp. SymC.cos]|nr:Polyphenol oxidase 2 [Leucoagaricus sp. SymC.cos]
MSLVATVGPTGGIKNRLDIVDFVKDEKFLTLYVRALQAIQARDQHSWVSFFQVAGIHGLPFTEWAKEQPSLSPYQAGYCTHGQPLFPTWHRPYVALYEQTIQEAANEAAKKFTVDKEAWAQAAQDLRQPYWDWGFQLVPPDEVIKNEQIRIVDYDGKKISVPNPILHYTFHPIDPSFARYANFNTWKTTVRNPDRNKREDISGKMSLEADQVREKTYNMLKFNENWDLFSNHAEFDDQHANSLEAVHDDIHGIVGYGQIRGHMTHPYFAAFDPIFWMHHSNVDRLLSLWSAMNPDVWVTPGNDRDGTMGIAPNTEVNKDTPLEPFYNSKDQAWTSANLADTSQFGYSYPDFDDLIGGSKELIRDAIENLVDERYGARRPRGATDSALNLLSNFKGVTDDHDDELKMYDWTIHATFRKFELDDSFALLFYFGADGGNIYQSQNYVGTINTFRGSTPETCTNCQNNENCVQEGFVHLNHYIARDKGSFEPEAVKEYLKEKKLSYKLFTDEEKPLTSLKVRVEGRPLLLGPGETRPTFDKSQSIVTFDDVVTFVSA